MKRKNVFVACVLAAMMVFATLPATAVMEGYYIGDVPTESAPVGVAPFSATTEAALSIAPMSTETINLATVMPGENGPGWSFGWLFFGYALTLYDGANVTVTTGGVSVEGRRIVIAANATATLTLSNAVLAGGVSMPPGRGNLTIYLEGENHCGGIGVPGGINTLTILGSGSLITGGIGGDGGGRITITGNANVTAIGGNSGGAGIGGGAANRITIADNATVTAIGGNGGAGIGSNIGGIDFDSGIITITGNANVTAIGGYPGGAGIGGGGGPGTWGLGGGVSGGTITIGGTSTVTAIAHSTGAAIGGGGATLGIPGASGTIRFEDYATVRAYRGTHNDSAIGPGTNAVGFMGSITTPVYRGANTNVTTHDPAVYCDECGYRPCRYCPDCTYCNDAGCPKCAPPVLTIPAITTHNAPNGTRGVSYRFQFAATGNPAPVWSHTALPPGLSLSEGGLLSGIPTEQGSFTFTVTATNSEGYDYREITIVISEPQLITDTALRLSTTAALPGQTATVQLRMSNNPGFSAMIMRLSFSEHLTLTGYTIGRPGIGDALEDFTPPTLGYTASFMGWKTRDDNIYLNDLFLTLTFSISNEAELGAFLPVEITFENYTGGAEAPTNADGEDVQIYITNGGVNVRTFMFGDANRSGSVTSADGTFLARYLALHPGFEIDYHAMDLNADGYVNLDDLVLLARWLVGHGAPPVIQNS